MPEPLVALCDRIYSSKVAASLQYQAVEIDPYWRQKQKQQKKTLAYAVSAAGHKEVEREAAFAAGSKMAAASTSVDGAPHPPSYFVRVYSG
jgi:hypothetical protein